VIALALRGPIEDGLLDGNSTLYWIGVAAITAYGVSYLHAASRRQPQADPLRPPDRQRIGVADRVPLAVALGIASGQTAVALGIVAAPMFSLIVVPFAFLRRGGRKLRRSGA
jgi:hypothetical protein